MKGVSVEDREKQQGGSSLIPMPLPFPVFGRLQYANTEVGGGGGGAGDLVTW